jgi:hypothetical protein
MIDNFPRPRGTNETCEVCSIERRTGCLTSALFHRCERADELREILRSDVWTAAVAGISPTTRTLSEGEAQAIRDMDTGLRPQPGEASSYRQRVTLLANGSVHLELQRGGRRVWGRVVPVEKVLDLLSQGGAR